MGTVICYQGLACLGCSLCEEQETDANRWELEHMQRIKKRDDALRAQGKPTLTVKLADFIKKR
jgi:hypothetical protein